jgi:hypothetical protein
MVMPGGCDTSDQALKGLARTLGEIEQENRNIDLAALRQILGEVAGDETRDNRIALAICHLGQVAGFDALTGHQVEWAYRSLEALKPSTPNDPLTLWLNDMCDDLRKAFQDMPLEQIPPRLAAACRAIELFEAQYATGTQPGPGVAAAGDCLRPPAGERQRVGRGLTFGLRP